MTTATSTDPTAPPPQPPRSSFSCDRHPHENFSGFCPSCLCERLNTLDTSNSNTPSSSRRPSSASAAIKSLFSKGNNNFLPPQPKVSSKQSKAPSVLPELRRTKSFSASKNEALGLGLGLICEPQRKSCDVRVRNNTTLSSLFTIDNQSKFAQNNNKMISSTAYASSVHRKSKKIDLKEAEIEEDFRDCRNTEDNISLVSEEDGDEIRPVQDSHLEGLRTAVESEAINGEILEEERLTKGDLKPMKDHLDFGTRAKKSSGGKFWGAASVFTKKWSNWRQKQKLKKQNNGAEKLTTLPVEKPIPRQYRETQSEIADYGFGRRSCDIDPRFSLDAGRISFDDPRYSFEEPRASWDGYLIGKSFPRMAAPPMVSVQEDAPIVRSDVPVLARELRLRCFDEDEDVPGGSMQTREYYLDSSSSRRKSLDRSSSIRKTAAAVVAEIDELKRVSTAKVSPATSDYFHGAKVVLGDRDLASASLRDDISGTFELSNGPTSVTRNEEGKGLKKLKRWSWRIWGFMQQQKNEDCGSVNGVERSHSQSWQGSRRGEGSVNNTRFGSSRNMFRSNSSVSWRNGNVQHIGGSIGGMRKPSMEMDGRKRNEIVLEKNRSARYSPNYVDNGLLRFHLAPKSAGRGRSKNKHNNSSHSGARSIQQLY